MIDVFFRFYNPFPPLDPRRPLHMLYTEQQKKRIFDIVYKFGVKYWFNDM